MFSWLGPQRKRRKNSRMSWAKDVASPHSSHSQCFRRVLNWASARVGSSLVLCWTACSLRFRVISSSFQPSHAGLGEAGVVAEGPLAAMRDSKARA